MKNCLVGKGSHETNHDTAYYTNIIAKESGHNGFFSPSNQQFLSEGLTRTQGSIFIGICDLILWNPYGAILKKMIDSCHVSSLVSTFLSAIFCFSKQVF